MHLSGDQALIKPLLMPASILLQLRLQADKTWPRPKGCILADVQTLDSLCFYSRKPAVQQMHAERQKTFSLNKAPSAQHHQHAPCNRDEY